MKDVEAAASPTVYLRADLEWEHRQVLGRDRWIIRDPLTLRFFYLSANEYKIAELLTQPCLLQDVIAMSQSPGGLSERAVRRFLQGLSRAGLLRIVDAKTIRERGPTIPRTGWGLQSLVSMPLRALAVRIPLGDPSHFLQRTDWIGHTFFNRAMLVALVAIWIIVGFLLAFRLDRFDLTFLELGQSLGWQGVVLLAIAYAMLKSLHELSHALACRRFGAECHEVGLYLLCFTPCFYCDVTDSWRIKNRFQRAGISAAGVYAELWIAGFAGLLWMFTNPGMLHAVALSMFVVGSVGTIFINCNPLLRYDGYYVLSDLCNVPNLAQQTTQAIWISMRRLVSRPDRQAEFQRGKEVSQALQDAPRGLLVLFGLASWAYKLIVLAVILWALDLFFAQMRIAAIGRTVVLALLVAAVAQMSFAGVYQFRKLWRHPVVSRVRLACLTGFSGVAIALFAFTPYQLDVGTTGILNTGQRTPIYADRAGILLESKGHGSRIEREDVLYRLHSNEELLRVAELEASVEELRQRVEGIKILGAGSVEVAATRETLVQLLDSQQNQLAAARDELDLLVGRSPRGGRIFAAEVNDEQAVYATSYLEAVRGGTVGLGRRRISDAACRGRYVRRGELLGWIMEDGPWIVDAYVGERQVERVRVGAVVRVRLEDRPWLQYGGIVQAISRDPVTEQAKLREAGLGWATEKYYPLRIELVDVPVFGEFERRQTDRMLARLRIETAAESFASRVRRYLAETVRW